MSHRVLQIAVWVMIEADLTDIFAGDVLKRADCKL